MSPLLFLTILLAITIVAAAVQFLSRRRRIRNLRQLAAEWRMHYSAADPFQLAPRVAALLPIPGAAAVRIIDLIYGIEGENYRFLLTAEFTTGVLRSKSRGRVVTSFTDPRDRTAIATPAKPLFAPQRLSVIAQYRHLHEAIESSGH